MFGGVGTVWGPVIGAAILIPLGRDPARRARRTSSPASRASSSALAIVVVILVAPEGMFWKAARLRAPPLAAPGRGGAGRAAATPLRPAAATQAAPAAAPVAHAAAPAAILRGARAVEELRRPEGGAGRQLRRVAEGTILGIIGPNGAGKTTAVQPAERLPAAGRRPDRCSTARTVVGRKPHQLCAAGVGRTFQIMRPFARMTVADNVVIGAYVRARDGRGGPASLPRRDRARRAGAVCATASPASSPRASCA